MTTRRGAAAAAGAVLLLVACSPATTSPLPGPTRPTPTASAGAAVDLTRPGAARRAVEALVKAAGGLPVIKVDVDARSATLSALKDGRVVAWGWSDGRVTPVESDIQYIQQAAFSPLTYDLSDLGALFQKAAAISGSSSSQELQIVEYDHGLVLMTVTTRPESMPVFFRADGSPVNQLDFPSTAAFSEALRDVTGNGRRVLQMGWSETGGFWADSASATSGEVERVTRQAKVPPWTSSRKADAAGPTFPATQVDPAVLSRLVTTLPATLRTPGAPVSFTIGRIAQMALPVVTFDVGGQKVVTTLGGADITDVVGG